ncbi:hypothetical protein ACFFGH_14975 [Lysobacter korlensis]|uniref:Beta-barrel assembly machine subunit BamC n=1 Tax=Lysobacter korlensis TaxID=553636 RepID=A0ABV6RQS6_9GAMM
MSVSVRVSAPLSRVVAGVLVAGLVATSGCSWFRRGDALYANDPANRPLEVPPALELPRADATTASAAAAGASATTPGSANAGAAVAASAGGFVVPGSRDAVFDRVGEVLGNIPGVVVVSRAQLLGAYDVTYEGSSFLVRIGAAETGSTVSAVDPRGVPASGAAPAKLMAQLKATLGGN